MRAIVLLNAAAGKTASSDTQSQEVRDALIAANIEPDIRPVEGSSLSGAAAQAIADRADAVIAAGGDGTVSAVASTLAGSEVPLGVLPMGTLNHFAKDLGLPFDIHQAAKVVADNNIRQVDVARVNDRIFVNNSSIGLYPHVVRQRDDMRTRLGRGKWAAMLTAVLALLRWFPTVRLRMSVNGETFLRTTPFVFVGNNHYNLDLFNLGQRSRLDSGELCLYFTNRTGRTGLLRLALRTLFGRLSQDRDFNALCAGEVWIDASKRHLSVALDGEVVRLRPPLHFRIWPKALKVFLPR